jgi:hypothetical protein
MKVTSLLILTALPSLLTGAVALGRSPSVAAPATPATPTVTPTATPTVTPTVKPTLPPPPPPAQPITLHFPRTPVSGYNFEYTYNVTRLTTNPRKDIAALQAIFGGPTAAEVASAPGLQAPLPLLAANACAGQTLPLGAMNGGRFMFRRTITGTDIAYKIRFCAPYSSGGIGTDARLQNAVKETLWANIPYVSGVNNITQIEIATSNNACLGGSGNTCWP